MTPEPNPAETFPLEALVSPQVAAGLDPDKLYGIWWYGRGRHKYSQVSEPAPDGNGRVYRRRRRSTPKDRSEWIAVPVPDAGIPLEVVEAARRSVGDYKTGSKARGRFWELSGQIARCSECGRAIIPRPVKYKLKSGWTSIINYYRCSKAYSYNDGCPHTKVYRSEDLEARVWNLVLSLLRDPDRLRAALDKLIEQERAAYRGDPEKEARVWLKKIAEIDHTRGRYQDMAAEGLITFDELRSKLGVLEETRATARIALDTLEDRRGRLDDLERDKAALLETYSKKASDGLDHFTSEERHQTYKRLRLSVVLRPGGDLEISGMLGEASGFVKDEATSRSIARRRRNRAGGTRLLAENLLQRSSSLR